MGEDTGDTLFVYDINSETIIDRKTNIANINNGDIYKEKEEYLLVLERHISVYNEHDNYLNSDIYIPLIDLSASTVDGRAFSELSSEPIFKRSFSRINLIDYLTEATKNNKNKFYGSNYIKSEKIEEIIIHSPNVVQIEIGKEIHAGAVSDRKTFICKVIHSYKGALQPESTIEVAFLNGTTKQGGKYIVSLDKSDETGIYYILSSKNSVFPVIAESEILKYISE